MQYQQIIKNLIFVLLYQIEDFKSAKKINKRG